MAHPPPQPTYVLRGHAAPIHATAFVRSNSRLLTGDADGWVGVWSLATRRAVAVWRAHGAAILGCAAWGGERLITHGKDNKLIVWKLREQEEEEMSRVLPVDDATSIRKQPWILHILHVNSLNFCSFAHCKAQGEFTDASGALTEVDSGAELDELLIAVPNALTSEAVDIFHLPSQKRLYTIPGPPGLNTGMVMALAIFYQNTSISASTANFLTVITGFESGHTTITQRNQTLYAAHPHTQPILSLSIFLSPQKSFYFTSGADAVVAKHPIQLPLPTSSLQNEQASEMESKPLKVVQTKHSGQQSLQVRSDGRVFATAGWDGRVRVYAVASMKELAVLKWHKEGCFAVAFAVVGEVGAGDGDGDAESKNGNADVKEAGEASQRGQLVSGVGSLSIREKREARARETHWLAAGSKDGKVSLWEIY